MKTMRRSANELCLLDVHVDTTYLWIFFEHLSATLEIDI